MLELARGNGLFAAQATEKRGHIVVALLLSDHCFRNVDSFCHAQHLWLTQNVSEKCQKHLPAGQHRRIRCSNNVSCLPGLCTQECIWKSSETSLCNSRGAQQCCSVLPQRPTSQSTMLPGPKRGHVVAATGNASISPKCWLTLPRVQHLWRTQISAAS